MSTGTASRVGFVVALGAALAAVCLPLAGTAQGAVRCTIVGTSGADTLVGTSRKDVICGRGGKDVLRGRGGGDVLDGGSGADTLDGGGGADKLLGGTGNDRLRGSGGGDLLFGQGGADDLLGGTGVDYLTGGGGADTLDGRDVPAMTDYLYCQADPDVAFVDAQDLFGSDCETVHHAPTDIVLSNAEVPEGQPAGTVVGTLSATDADVGDSHIFSLVGGSGSDDNAKFQISGTQLQTSQILDHDADPSLSIRVQADDGHGGTIWKVFVISVEELTYPPALAGIETTALTYTENEPAKAVSSTITVTDADSAMLTGATVTIASGLASGDELTFTDQFGVTGSYGNGVLTLTGATSVANYQTALRAVKYVNTGDDPGATTRTITFQAMDGVGPGHLSNTVSRNVAVTPINDAAPVADDEFFGGANSAIGNTALVVNDPSDGAPTLTSPKKTITGDILAGDTDVEGAPLAATPVTDQATNDGGRVTIEADGDFVFSPAAGTSCVDSSDSFTYTVGDQDGGTDIGQVTVSISGCVWYVSNNAAGNSGTSDRPFDTLGQAETVSSANQTVFVFDGDNTPTGYASGYALKAGQRLIGEHEGLVVDPDGGGPLGSDALYPANPGARPTLTATGEDVVDLDDGNEVRGFVLDPQGVGGGIAGSSGDTGGATIDDVNIVDGGTLGVQPGLELDATTGTFSISNLVVSNSATGVRLNNAGTVVFSPASDISITSVGAAGLSASGTNMGTSAFDQISVTSSISGGVTMSNTTGTTTFGDGLGLDLALHTAAGATPAFGVSNGGTIVVPAGATGGISTVNATGGPAISVTGTTIGAGGLTFQSVESNGATSGIVLDNTGPIAGLTVTGLPPFADSGGAIQNTSGHGIALNSTLNPSFSNMHIQNTGGSGVNGTGVTNFTFADGTIESSGDALGESNIVFNGNGTLAGNNIDGTLSVTNSTLTSAFDHGIHVENNDGTISNAIIQNNTITSTTSTETSKGSGVRLIGTGTAATVGNLTKATISGNTIRNFPSGAGIQVSYGNATPTGPAGVSGTPGDATNIITITNNTVRGFDATNRLGTNAILVSSSGVNPDARGQSNFNISNNGTVVEPIGNALGTVISLGNNGHSTMTATVNSNVIVANNFAASSGIGGGNGSVLSSAETPELTLTASNNTISQTDGNGILLVGRGATGLAKLTIENNNVAAPLTGVRPGIRVDAGNISSVDDAVCLDISGNTSAGSGGTEGIGLRKQGTTSTVNDFGIEGLTVPFSPGVQVFVNGQNPAGGGTLLISAESGFSNCSTAP